jgi:hypothetical protein
LRRVRNISIGFLIGALLLIGATTGYAAVKQYLLTEASYPIYVDGVAYSDKERPILNYGGNTYVPLAKLGDITGVNYTWNDSLKRVEIATGSSKSVTTSSKLGNETAKLSVTTAAIKQYLLTEASYPIYVDGVAYSDKERPILNYGGNTYVPLAKLGDITGVNYTWNESLKRVEIATGSNQGGTTSPKPGNETAKLSVTEGKGNYAGYKQLKGYPDSSKYAIYFKGNANSFHVTTEDLRGINLNEMVTWTHNGKTYKTSKKDLHAFFVDSVGLIKYLGYTDYTFTEQWYLDTFGKVFTEWQEGYAHENEAVGWVEAYFEQTTPSAGSNITLTPDAVVVVEENTLNKPTIGEGFGSNYPSQPSLSNEFYATWISDDYLYEKYSISVARIDGINFYKDGKEIYLIENVPNELEENKIYSGNDIRYQFISSNINGNLYFNRADLKKLGFIE